MRSCLCWTRCVVARWLLSDCVAAAVARVCSSCVPVAGGARRALETCGTHAHTRQHNRRRTTRPCRRPCASGASGSRSSCGRRASCRGCRTASRPCMCPPSTGPGAQASRCQAACQAGPQRQQRQRRQRRQQQWRQQPKASASPRDAGVSAKEAAAAADACRVACSRSSVSSPGCGWPRRARREHALTRLLLLPPVPPLAAAAAPAAAGCCCRHEGV
jgi:hypothetical protein